MKRFVECLFELLTQNLPAAAAVVRTVLPLE